MRHAQRQAHERLQELLKENIRTHLRPVRLTPREQAYYADGSKSASENGKRGRDKTGFGKSK